MSKITDQSVFKAGYWAGAASEFRKIRSLVFAGLTIALGTVLNNITIPVGENLHISFAFLAVAFGSMIFGPVVGLSVGFAYDLAGFVLAPSAVFFPGYTLSSMLEFFLYGIFLYRSRFSVLRIAAVKALVNFGIHVGLGSLWSQILFGKGYYYFFFKSLVKNTVMLPIEIAMLVAALQLFLPFLVREGIIPKQERKFIPLF